MKLPQILALASMLFVPAGLASTPAHPDLEGCLFGASTAGGVLNVEFILNWDASRQVFVGELYVIDLTGLAPTRIIHVIGYHMSDGPVWSDTFPGIDINNDPLSVGGASETPVYLVGGYPGANAATLSLVGTLGSGVAFFTGTMSG